MKTTCLILLFILFLSACNGNPTATATEPIASFSPTPDATAVASSTPNLTQPTEQRTLVAGQWSTLIYHETLQKVILVNGGPERGKSKDDPLELWAWDGSNWSLISADANGPTWRNWAGVAYDTTRDVLVMHGGLQDANTSFDETWEWDGQTWTKFTGAGPGGREGALMAYDAAHEMTILFGGAADMQVLGDTWAWDGAQWTQVSAEGPPPRFPGGLIYDAARQKLLLYSGHFAEATGAFIDYDDLWAWDGSSWREIAQNEPTPGHRTHTAITFDPNTDTVLLISSGSETFLSDVWAWDGTQWTQVEASNTPARSGHNVVYDAARDTFVLFGGVDRPGGKALSDTWEWDRVNWLCVENCQ